MEGPNLSGQLSDWSIDDLLQIMQVTKKTGSLDVDGERRGRVHFVDGAVTGAELSGENGSYQGTDRAGIADILYVLSTLERGTFGLGAADGPNAEGFAVEDIMGDVSALRSLEGEVIDAGLFEAAGVKLVGDLDEPITLEPDDWRVFASLVQPFTLDFLQSRVGRGGAVRIFHTLHRLGVAETVSGDSESEWLDRLAGGLARSSEPTWIEEAAEDDGPNQAEPEDDQVMATVAAPELEPADSEPERAVSDPEPDPDPDPVSEPVPEVEPVGVHGVSADASTTLTDGVYDEIRRLRSKASDS